MSTHTDESTTHRASETRPSGIARLITLEHLDTDTLRSVGLFILRAAMILIIFHGIHKAQGYDGFVATMGKMPIGSLAPQVFGFLVVAGQLLLGIGLLIGLGTRYCAFFLALMFAFIITVVNIPFNGVMDAEKGGVTFEASLFYFIPALALIFTGPGKFSIDRLLARRK